jgi:hypothetical protein
MKVLNVISSAYRATLEEQDDTVVWFSHHLKGAGCDLTVLLLGNAVNYGVKGQDASGLTLGGVKQTQPPRPDQDLSALLGKGVEVYVVADDVAERGLEGTDLIPGLKTVPRAGLPKLFDRHERVWYW